MAIDYSEQTALSLMKKYYTRDPFALCDCLGIKVQSDDIGSLKGMYVYIKRNRYIVLNNRLDDTMQRMVCAHELGHDQLHRDMARYSFIHDSDLHDMTSTPEYEANVFAATLLIDDEALIDMAHEGMDIQSISSELGVDVNLTALKGRLLAKRGYRLNIFEHQASFLKS